MLKNVVLPAPFGPIRLTMDRSGMSKFTELTATRPPKTFVMPHASSRVLSPFSSGTNAPHRVAGAGVVVAQLLLALAVGDDALGPEQHHQHEDHAEDKEVVAGQVHVAHGGAAYRVSDGVHDGAKLRQGVEVDALEHDGAEDHTVDVPHPPEHDHTKYQYGDVEREGVGEDVLDERPVERAGEPPEEGAQGVGPQLRRYGIYAHGRGGRLVLAHRDPGSPEPGVLQAHVDVDGNEHHREDRVVPGVQVQRAEPLPRIERVRQEREARRVYGLDAYGPVSEVEAAEVVPVLEEPGDDLAEPERHDGEVVPPQPQGREADDHAADRGESPSQEEQYPERDVYPVGRRAAQRGRRRAEGEAHPVEVRGGEPPDHVGPERVERHETEVEQARETDHDVEAEGQHHEDGNGDRGEKGVRAEGRVYEGEQEGQQY